MTERNQTESNLSSVDSDLLAELRFDPHIPWPLLLNVSGLYEWRGGRFARRTRPASLEDDQMIPDLTADEEGSLEEDAPRSGAIDELSNEAHLPIFPFFFGREELRLDVDGRYPQQTASGSVFLGLSKRADWIANLRRIGRNRWAGRIWYKRGMASSFPYTAVTITAKSSFFAGQRKVTVLFSGGGANPRSRTYRFKSNYFHKVEFEFDTVTGAPTVTTVDTGEHPNRPTSLPSENLSIETVYRRAGFDVSRSGGQDAIPLINAGVNGTWSDMEMHDAMQTFWSRFTNKPQWSTWLLLASLHDRGSTLGGIMFDDIGPNHRQGTAVFGDTFIANAPIGDPNPAAWVQRMRFWTAVHEMGHSFNLAHSWQKEHPASWGTSWIPLANEYEERSFMNYPFRVSGGQADFFSDFEYRFSDSELLFMRHAPSQFVEMGNADWFDDHGFEQVERNSASELSLELRVNRDKAQFEFLEPATVELKLKNESNQKIEIDKNLLANSENLTIIIKRRGRPARQWTPYASYSLEDQRTLLDPGEAIYHSQLVAAGRNGWDLAEPGQYVIQVALHIGDQIIVSNALALSVSAPISEEEERLAQDIFTDDVGRTLTFGGTRYFDGANTALQNVAERLSDRRIALHARLALARPDTRNYKILAKDRGEGFRVGDAKPDQAKKALDDVLIASGADAAESLGHIEYRQKLEDYRSFLESVGDKDGAASCQSALINVLSGRRVLKRVIEELEGYRAVRELSRK